MIHRTIAAALLIGLASPALAGVAMDQANGLTTGRSPDAVFDGSAPRAAVQTQVDGALKTGDLAVEAPPVPPASVTGAAHTASYAAAPVPEPTQDGTKGKFFTKRGLTIGVGGAVAGGAIGWLLGGPIGAAIGALAGFAIGFLLSKLLKR